MYDELIKQLRNRRMCIQGLGTLNDYPLLGEAADAIEELSKPRWISVKERLPSVGDKVIVAIREEIGYTRYDYTNTGWYSGNGEKWVVEDEYCSWVTRWMPLPEPPEEEGEK